jgi:hypothetical protein
MESDLAKSKEMVAKIRDLSFLLKETQGKVSTDEYTRNILNLLSYSTLLEKHFLSMQNTHFANHARRDRHKDLKPAFQLSNHLANQKARELLD